MIRVVLRVVVWEGLSSGPVLGLMSEVMLDWVRVWGDARLISRSASPG
jgi:hypothetical protein